MASIAAAFRGEPALSLDRLRQVTGASAGEVLAWLNRLAMLGQVIHDLPASVFRWRQVMPRALGEAEIGPEHAELAGARTIMARGRADLKAREEAPRGGYVLTGVVDNDPVEVLVDADGRIRRGKCVCGYFRRFGLRNGPCRHMLALRWRSSAKALEAMRASDWYGRM